MKKEKRQIIENDWRYRLMVLCLKLTGLTRVFSTHDSISTCIICVHYFLTALELVFSLQCVVGIIVSNFFSDQVNLRETVFYFQFFFLSFGVFIKGCALLSKRDQFAECLRTEPNLILHCSTQIDEKIIVQKYIKAYNILMMIYILTFPMTTFLVITVSPLVRFFISTKQPTYVLRRVWYPVNVMTSRGYFWCAFVYELVLLVHMELFTSCIDFVYVHLMMKTSVRFDTLGCYLSEGIETGGEEFGVTAISDVSETKLAKIMPRFKNFKGNLTDLRQDRLKKGIDDWNVLWRFLKLALSICQPSASGCVIQCIPTITLMTFTAVIEFLNSDKSGRAFAQATIFFFYVLSGSGVTFVIHYASHLLQQSVDRLRFAVWCHNWTAEGVEHKKLINLFLTRLNHPLRMRIFTFVKIDLKRYGQYITRSNSYITFLLQLSRTK